MQDHLPVGKYDIMLSVSPPSCLPSHTHTLLANRESTETPKLGAHTQAGELGCFPGAELNVIDCLPSSAEVQRKLCPWFTQ